MSATREEPEWPDHSWLWDNQEHADITVVLVDRESMLAWRKKSESPSKEQTRAAKKARTDELNVSEAASTMQAESCTQDHAEPQGLHIWANKSVLGSFSEYFRKRITGFKDDPSTLKQPDGRLTLVVEVEEELTEAAHDVIKLMYHLAVPQGLTPRYLAKMVHVADRWMAPACVRRCFVALTQLENPWQQPEELSSVLSWLPDSTSALPQYAAWEQKWQKHVISMFRDVYTVLTSSSLLRQFRCLPFSAVRAWAASDQLRVDSENSVAVAISWWYGGQEGRRSSKQQLEELSGLLRISRLSTAYRLIELPKLSWFKCKAQDLALLQVAAAVGVYDGCVNLPPGWLADPRQPSASGSTVTINWDIPHSHLHAALGKTTATNLLSPPVYFAGTGVQLCMQVEARSDVNAPRNLGLFLERCSYSCETAKVASAHQFVLVKYVVTHKKEGRTKRVFDGESVIADSWGIGEAFTVSSPLDLQPLLSDGSLKVSAELRQVQEGTVQADF